MLVICEGSKSEPKYFEGFRVAKRLPQANVEIVPGNRSGNDPKRVVEYATRRKREAKNGGFEYDEIWCVFDRDQHERWDQALNQASANNINVAFSVPCFELWLLLHYRDQRAAIERHKTLELLKEHLPDYAKGMSGVYETVLAGQTDAIRRAAALRKQHADTGQTEHTNPSTAVDKLVEVLNALQGAAHRK